MSSVQKKREEEEERIVYSNRLKAHLIKGIQHLAIDEGKNQRDIIEEALDVYLKRCLKNRGSSLA